MKKINIIKTVLLMTILTIVLFLILQHDKVWILWVPRLRPAQISPLIEGPSSASSSLSDLSPTNVRDMVEISAFQLSTGDEEVIAISEHKNQEAIMAVGSHGSFVHWNMGTHQIVKRYNFYSAYRGSTYFSMDGSRLLSGGEVIWDTDNGTIIECFEQCDDVTNFYEENFSVLSPSGTLIISHGPIIIKGVNNKHLTGTVYYLHDDCFFKWPDAPAPDIGFVAIDTTNTYVAYSLNNETICIREINGLVGYDVQAERALTLEEKRVVRGQLRYVLNENTTQVIDMKFDPTRRWFATLTGRELSIWNLQGFLFPQQMSTAIDSGTTINFDRSGDLLALGTKHGIILYNVKSGREVAEFRIGNVTALYFTRDNRLLVWGDAEGNIHLWGVPNP